MNRRHVIRSLFAAIAALFGVRGARESEAVPGGAQTIDGVAWMPVRYEEFTGGAGEPLAELALIPMPDVAPGVPYCPRCERLPAFDIPWQGPDHVAVRLWDHSDAGQTLTVLQMPTNITVDGDPIKWGLEAYAGPNGWALVDRVARCPTCRGDLQMLLTGNVVFSQPKRDSTIAAIGRDRVERIESHLLERRER